MIAGYRLDRLCGLLNSQGWDFRLVSSGAHARLQKKKERKKMRRKKRWLSGGWTLVWLVVLFQPWMSKVSSWSTPWCGFLSIGGGGQSPDGSNYRLQVPSHLHTLHKYIAHWTLAIICFKISASIVSSFTPYTLYSDLIYTLHSNPLVHWHCQ